MPGTVPRGEVRDQMTHGCDWLPTIADFSEVSVPSTQMDGKSLKRVILEDAPSPHEKLYWRLGRGKNAQWVVQPR